MMEHLATNERRVKLYAEPKVHQLEMLLCHSGDSSVSKSGVGKCCETKAKL